MSNKDSNNDGASGSSQMENKYSEVPGPSRQSLKRKHPSQEMDEIVEWIKNFEANDKNVEWIKNFEANFTKEDFERIKREFEVKKRELEVEIYQSKLTVFEFFDNDVRNYENYLKALSEGEENDNSIRVNVVGNFAQGKTSLTNILVGKDLESVQSTNGVEISSCKYSNAHEGVKFCSQISSSDDNEYLRRIASLVQIEKDGNKSNQSTVNSKLIKLIEESTSLRGNIRKTGLKKDIGKSSPKSRDYHEVSKLLKMNPCDTLNTDGDLQFWDFGGQFIFYATHTLFHSKSSVYLMVFDLTKPLSAIIEDPEFPNENVGKSMQQYAEYWMRSIHTYVGSDDGLQPPVILVGTHKDLLKGDENSRQIFADDYFDQIRELFEDTPIINHIQAKHFAFNCTNPCDSSIVELRKEIIRLGSNLHGKLIPARWLPLEKQLLAKKHKKIILYSEVVEIDGKNEFPLKEQIKVFLLYQHAKGNLIYFDEEPLSAYVALDTQYVIDAFRCIITSERFCKREPTYRHLWKTLRQEAKLNMQLLESVWGTDAKNNFLEHKEVLLMLMQRHHIISEALSYDDETEETKGLGWYVVPCFLRPYRAYDTLKKFVTGRQQTLLKFVMSFNISPLVQIVFYRVIAALVGKWEIASIKIPEQEKQVLLYENLGVFRLDRHHVGIIELHQGFIDLWVQHLCNSGINAAIVDLFRRFVVSNVMNEFRKHRQTSTIPRSPFEICFKCNHESHCLDGSQQIVSLEDIKETTVEPCPDMVSGHTINTKKAHYEWFPDDLNIELKTDFVLKERDLSKLSTTVGENWEKLGIELGLRNIQLEHIKMDYPRTEMRIFKMLLKWTDQMPGDATLNSLIHSMKSATEVSIDWDEVKNIVEEIISKNSIKLAPKTSTSHEI